MLCSSGEQCNCPTLFLVKLHSSRHRHDSNIRAHWAGPAAVSIPQHWAAWLQDEFAVNEDITSQDALKEYLMRQAQQQDPQDTGILSWDKLLQILQKLSQDCLSFTATDLACMLGYAAQDAAEVMQYSQTVAAVSAQVLSYINPRMTAARLAAMDEYRQRDVSEKKRGNEQLIQV